MTGIVISASTITAAATSVNLCGAAKNTNMEIRASTNTHLGAVLCT
jgi:hypothetical protein